MTVYKKISVNTATHIVLRMNVEDDRKAKNMGGFFMSLPMTMTIY